jgi:hypothetical protein
VRGYRNINVRSDSMDVSGDGVEFRPVMRHSDTV